MSNEKSTEVTPGATKRKKLIQTETLLKVQ